MRAQRGASEGSGWWAVRARGGCEPPPALTDNFVFQSWRCRESEESLRYLVVSLEQGPSYFPLYFPFPSSFYY